MRQRVGPHGRAADDVPLDVDRLDQRLADGPQGGALRHRLAHVHVVVAGAPRGETERLLPPLVAAGTYELGELGAAFGGKGHRGDSSRDPRIGHHG